MALTDDPIKKHERDVWRQRVRDNPALGMSLGELVAELYKICASDPNVMKPEKEIPKKSLSNYEKYRAIIDELNARDRKYTEPENPIIS
jgi:hypothetical protein